jgi:hypothetical protein
MLSLHEISSATVVPSASATRYRRLFDGEQAPSSQCETFDLSTPHRAPSSDWLMSRRVRNARMLRWTGRSTRGVTGLRFFGFRFTFRTVD